MSTPVRFVAPDRAQWLKQQPQRLDELIEQNHEARRVWDFVEGLDSSALFARIRSVVGGPGRPASDPRVLLALWLFGLSHGVTSARELDRLRVEHRAYQWLCGGVPVDYHLLADFRSKGAEELDQMLTTMIVSLKNAGVIDLEEVAIDGLRTRAQTAAQSFLTPVQVQQLAKLIEDSRAKGDKTELRRKQQAARQRAQRERQQAVTRAHQAFAQAAQRKADALRKKGARGLTAAQLLQLNGWEPAAVAVPPRQALRSSAPKAKVPERLAPLGPVQQARLKQALAQKGFSWVLRVSVTDEQATVLKMADGGLRPGYNHQLMTETKRGLIVDAFVGLYGSDQPYVELALRRYAERYGGAPLRLLADGNYFSGKNVARVAACGGRLYSRPPKGRKSEDRYAPAKKDTKALALWRQQMGTALAQQIYQRRAQHAELSNARLRNQGLRQTRTRRRDRVSGELCLHALAVNMKVLKYRAPKHFVPVG